MQLQIENRAARRDRAHDAPIAPSDPRRPPCRWPIDALDRARTTSTRSTPSSTRAPRASSREDRLPGADQLAIARRRRARSNRHQYKQVSAFDARKRGAALVAAQRRRAHRARRARQAPRTGRRSSTAGAAASAAARSRPVLDADRLSRPRARRRLPRLPARRRRRARTSCRRAVVRASSAARPDRARAGCSQALAARRARRCSTSRRSPTTAARCSASSPGSLQPSQKAFDTAVWDALRRLDPARPVFVESESKKVGDLRVPRGADRGACAPSPCLWLELPLDAARRALLIEYDFFVTDIDAFCARLDALRDLRGNGRRRSPGRTAAARRPRPPTVVRDLLVAHYDPIYLAVDAPQLRRRRRTRRDACAGTAAKHRCARHRWRRSKRERFPSGHSRASAMLAAASAGAPILKRRPLLDRPWPLRARAQSGESCDGAWPRSPSRRGRRGRARRSRAPARGVVMSRERTRSGVREVRNLLAIVDPLDLPGARRRCKHRLVVEQECAAVAGRMPSRTRSPP